MSDAPKHLRQCAYGVGQSYPVTADICRQAADPMGDYYTGLRCGVEDRDIVCRYEAAEYGWEQAFEYIGSIATGALLGGGE